MYIYPICKFRCDCFTSLAWTGVQSDPTQTSYHQLFISGQIIPLTPYGFSPHLLRLPLRRPEGRTI